MNTQSARRSSAFLTVDLEQDGKQFGHINIPQSPNNDAWASWPSTKTWPSSPWSRVSRFDR